jgi:hypothetical protein
MVQVVAEAVTYEHVGKLGAERAVQDAKAVEAAKEAKKRHEGCTRHRTCCYWHEDTWSETKKHCIRGYTAALKANTFRTRDVQDVAEVERDVGALGLSAKVAELGNELALPSSTEILAERGTVLDSWRAPVARMW